MRKRCDQPKLKSKKEREKTTNTLLRVNLLQNACCCRVAVSKNNSKPSFPWCSLLFTPPVILKRIEYHEKTNLSENDEKKQVEKKII
jgi:hypothetical protein